MKSRITRLAPPAVIFVLTCIAFLPALQNGFVTWDDDRNFLGNPSYRGLGAAQLHWMWTTFHMGHYVPLSWMTLGLDYELWGMDARGYHATSILIHAAAAVLLYFVARRVLRLARPELAANTRTVTIAAAFAAIAFAVHPLRVESVAWVTERRDVLSGFFVAASLLCYLICVEEHRRRMYWYAVALYVCALLSKATSLTLPAVLLVLNVYPLRRVSILEWRERRTWRVAAEIAPFALLGLATIPLTIVALAPPTQLSFGGKIAVSAYSLMFYVWKTIVPAGLSPLYAMPKHLDLWEPRFIAGYLFIVAVAAAIWAARKRFPGLVAACLIFLAVILPMLGIVQNGPQIAADRYTYHASPALMILLAGALLPLFAGAHAKVMNAAAAVVVLILMTLSWRQTTVWHDPRRFWTYVLSTDATLTVAEIGLGDVSLEEAKYDEAIAHLTRALRLDSTYTEGYDNLGVALSHVGRVAEAIPVFQHALALNPRNRETHNNLGVALASQGRLNEAVAEYEEAIELDPEYADAQTNLGNALVRGGRPADALSHYEMAVRLRPQNADAQLNWGVALAQMGRMPEAIEHFRAALAIDPSNASAREYLDRASAAAGASRKQR